MVVSPAYAQGIGGAGGFDIISLFPLVLIFVVFYFLLIRPQQRKAKVHREMIGALRRGDNVVTGGGSIGRVTRVLDDERIMVEIAENVRVQIARGTVSNVMARGEPIKETRVRSRDEDRGAAGRRTRVRTKKNQKAS